MGRSGRQKLVDTAGRVERFIAKYGDRNARGGKDEKTEPEEAAEEVAVVADA